MRITSGRRTCKRSVIAFPVEIQILYPFRKPLSKIKGETANISDKGLSVVLEKPVPCGVVVNLRLNLSSHYALIGAEALVIWTGFSPKGDKFRCGLRFLGFSNEERYTGLFGSPGSYEEAFILRAEGYSNPIPKKILKRRVPLKSIIPEIERTASRLWYAYGRYLHKDFDDMMKEQLDLIREKIRNNKYIPGWDEDLTEELLTVIKRELHKSRQ